MEALLKEKAAAGRLFDFNFVSCMYFYLPAVGFDLVFRKGIESKITRQLSKCVLFLVTLGIATCIDRDRLDLTDRTN